MLFLKIRSNSYIISVSGPVGPFKTVFKEMRSAKPYRTKRKNDGKNKEARKKAGLSRIVKLACFAAAALSLAFLIQNGYFYLTESGTDEDEPYPVKGVDVSVYQQDIDWEGLASEGVEFAFIKATEGSSHVDRRFEENWKGAKAAGIKRGAYHFLSYDTPGESQAENYTDTVGMAFGALPPAVDVEFYGEYHDSPPSKNQMYDVLDAVLEKLEEKYGKKPLIYTNTHIYETYISGRYDDYGIWISDHDIPDTLPDGKKWTFCQYTFRAVSRYVAGGEKYFDMNVFNGSKWDFRWYKGN